MTVSELIKEARQKAGLTQEALAEKMEIDAATISRWENGQTPRVQTLVDLAAALGTTLDQLVKS